jgi:sigma-B regulation protein RsbU (phosphoserine phosphatase)
MRKTCMLLLLLFTAACGEMPGQNFDLTTGRVPVASLDGLWRFHTGDDPAWADPNFDDSKWALLRSDEDWARQGYKDYTGLAWYRFQVTVPAGMDYVSLYLPHLFTCFEVYADGSHIGTYGKMPPDAIAFSGGSGFLVYPLPTGVHGQHRVQIALRVWHWPGWVGVRGGGPQHGGGLVGASSEIEKRDTLGWSSELWSLAGDYFMGLLEALAGLGGLVLFLARRKEPEYLWFGLMMMLSAASEWIDVSSAQVWNVLLSNIALYTLNIGFSLASIVFYRQLFQARRTLFLKLAMASAVLEWLIFLVLGEPRILPWAQSQLLMNLCRLVGEVWIFTVVYTRARQRSIDARLLLVPTSLDTFLSLAFTGGWIARLLGWRAPFGFLTFSVTLARLPIQSYELTTAFDLLFLFAVLILRFARMRSQDERFASEVQAARDVQQFLIPAQLPQTPGFRIESEYRPAREVGGDFFQVLPQSEDGSVLIVQGDVAGKGMQAGMLATLIVGAIRTAAAFTVDPEKILALLNERLQGRGLVTCLVLRIDQNGDATLVNAGHLAPYLNGSELPMEGALPLGAILGVDFPVLHFQLAQGDSLMLMSDGIAEAQNAKGSLFGFERIGEMMSQRATAAGLATAAQDFGQADDITVLTVARMAVAGASTSS